MLHACTTKTLAMLIVFLVPVTIVFSQGTNSAPYQSGQANGQAPVTNEQQNPNFRSPQLTPEQQAAQQRAAQEAFAAQQQKKIIQPEGFPLSAEHTQYVDDLLSYWEQNSNAVSKYKCNFRRFTYDTDIVDWRAPQSNQLAAHEVAFGEIRFAAPDRARYETTRVMRFAEPPQQPGGEAKYKESEGNSEHERWICDGTRIYEFDFQNKRLTESEMPQEMQGNIAESPLPFIFGGNKTQVLKRYWVRSATPKGVENEYWLELYPKRIQDARVYSKIELVIAKEDFLPKAMHMYDAQYNPAKGNEASKYFTFESRQVNNQLDKFKDALGLFVRPKLPDPTWKRVEFNQIQNQAATPPQLQIPSGVAGSPPATRRDP
ncbi:MAG: hypothetical protein P8J27_14235 [Mariniblastus sp.]|nr:hypothetical protein [Mariniblastus sp.]